MENINESAAAGAGATFSVIMKSIDKLSDFLDKRRSKNSTSNSLSNSSIMSASKDLVMSFPVICSTNISPKTALLIQRAVERNCLTTLQMLFAANALEGGNGVDVIKKWHNNLKMDVSMDDYFNYIDNIGASVDKAGNKILGLESAMMDTNVENYDYYNRYAQRMIEECKKNTKFYPNSFSESSLLSYELSTNKRTGNIDVKVVTEDFGNNNIAGSRVIHNPYTGQPYLQTYTFDAKDAMDSANTNAKDNAKLRMQQASLNNDIRNVNNQIDQTKIKQDELELKKGQYYGKNLGSKSEYIQRQLLDSDIKKANELVPSMLVVRYNVASPSAQQFVRVDEFVAGVKARLIGCDSAEIIDRVRLAMENKVDVKNFVRATTGEIRFCKDFILAIDSAKIEAKRNSKLSKTSPIWRALQNRSNKSTFRRLMKYNNTAAAITSLVISAEEVNRLSTQYNIDILNVKKAKEIMEAYNFMEIIIVDEALEVAKFLLDNNDGYFQDYSFAALQKETSDTELRKTVNLMASMNR